MKSIGEWQEMVHQNARDHGWWDGVENKDPRVIPEKLCLIHSEVSEALECYREIGNLEGAGYALNESIYDGEDGDISLDRFLYTENGNDLDTKDLDRTKPRKPIGLDSEFADIVIRVMDLCSHLGIDLGKAILEKHQYNVTRPFKHGGKRC